MEMMNELKDTVLSATSNESFKQEQVLLERYTMRDINTLSGPFLDKFTHQAIKNLCAMPKMNPLNLPPALFSKKFLSKESKSTESSAQKWKNLVGKIMWYYLESLVQKWTKLGKNEFKLSIYKLDFFGSYIFS